jgi:hypothetical protein
MMLSMKRTTETSPSAMTIVIHPQPTLSYHLDDADKDDDLAEVMFGSPIMEDLLDKARKAGTIG